ncbi:patatin-like phospholipase family protein [Nocardioides sp.]|uniref:patatin-like phospholipase family protein n=1 Tax=Nocardioides sp. TaxID=35761 RepID=UPI003511B395
MRALVLGCGGTLGFAWSAHVVAALADAGWQDPEILVGTSAGAELAAMLGAGLSAAEVVRALDEEPDADPRLLQHVRHPVAPLPSLPRPSLPALGLASAALRGHADGLALAAGLLPRGGGDAGFLHRLGHALAERPSGWVAHPATWLVAADARSGQRVAFGRPDAPRARLAPALAASWAVPGLFPPVTIGRRRYLDGGAVSPTSADLLLPAVRTGRIREVAIVAPMSTHGGAPGRGLSRLERLVRAAMTRRVDEEVRLLRAHGARVVRLEPGTDDLTVMGPNFLAHRRRPAVLDVARRTAPALVAARLAAPPDPGPMAPARRGRRHSRA